MKTSQLKMIIREVVREEIRLGLQEIIGDFKKPKQRVVQPKRKVIEKQKFYDIVNSRLDRIYITKEQVDPRTNKIFTKRIELNKFIN